MSGYRGKELVCQLTTWAEAARSPANSRTLLLASDKLHIYLLLLFFLRTQTVLHEHVSGACVVRTLNSLVIAALAALVIAAYSCFVICGSICRHVLFDVF